MTKTTINKEEVEKFSKIADEWWDEGGKFKPLHNFNPIRLSFIKSKIVDCFKLEEESKLPLKGLEIVDVGCGGGLISEPIAKMGAKVLGIDASLKNINVAQIHAKESGVDVDYQNFDVEELAEKKNKFDVVMALEIIEHVDNVDNFVKALSKIVKKNGLVFVATVNRNTTSYLKAILGAEYVLRWLPIGTHDWKKFLKPSEIFAMMNPNGLELLESKGFEYCLFKDEWKLSDNLDVNYLMVFEKK